MSYDPDFDSTVGGTERPDVRAARAAMQESRTGGVRTDAAIEESRRLMENLREIRVENHFIDKFRSILHGAPS